MFRFPRRDPRIVCAALVALSLSLPSCSGGATEPDGERQAVVGGQAEARYPWVGFLRQASSTYHPSCTVSLIARDVVVTAAHCVHGPAEGYVVGFGDPHDATPGALRRKVKAIHLAPDYRRVSHRAWNDSTATGDLALLVLDEPVRDRTPAVIARAATTCDHRYVGYGRSAANGFTGERKSVPICVAGQNTMELLIEGEGGSVCWGDSGGPLMIEDTNRLTAVLSRASPSGGTPCEAGSRAIMTKLLPHYADFIETYAPGALEAPPPSGPPIMACVVDAPEVIHTREEVHTPTIYARVHVENESVALGPTRRVRGEIGAGPSGTRPWEHDWNWYLSYYDGDSDDDDRWRGAFAPLTGGTFDVAFRFTSDGGSTYTYCDRHYALREYDPEHAVKLHVDR